MNFTKKTYKKTRNLWLDYAVGHSLRGDEGNLKYCLDFLELLAKRAQREGIW